MEQEEIINKIIEITGDHFSESGKTVSAETVSADIPGWNSLQHVMLIAKIEKAFEIKFDLLQMIDMKSIEDIAKATNDLINS